MILTKDVIYFYQNNNKDILRKKTATKYRYKKKNRGRKWVKNRYLISYLSSDGLNSQSVAPISSSDFRFNGVHSYPNIWPILIWIILGVNSVAFENQGNSVSFIDCLYRDRFDRCVALKDSKKDLYLLAKEDGRGLPVLFISAREFLQRLHPEMSKYLIAKRKKKKAHVVFAIFTSPMIHLVCPLSRFAP